MLTFLAFIGTSIIVIVTPGPDTATTIRSTLLAGRTGGICTAAGIAVGQTVWALATSVGLAALLVASAPLFLTIKYLGAAYLIYLGICALCEAVWPPEQGSGIAMENHSHGRISLGMAFRQGLISDLSNPKMAVFFNQPASPVRTDGRFDLRDTARSWNCLCRHDIPLARILCRSDPQGAECTSTPYRASSRGGRDRNGPDCFGFAHRH